VHFFSISSATKFDHLILYVSEFRAVKIRNSKTLAISQSRHEFHLLGQMPLAAYTEALLLSAPEILHKLSEITEQELSLLKLGKFVIKSLFINFWTLLKT
jgi:hypothetical protein